MVYTSDARKKSSEAQSATGAGHSSLGCGLLAGIILGTIGVVLLPVGLRKQRSEAALSPKRNFEELSVPCHIVGVHHRLDSKEEVLVQKSGDSANRKHQWVCQDTYSYMFTLEGVMYESREESIERGASPRSNCLGLGGPKPGTFSKGQDVKCWRPTASTVKVPDAYRCSNNECVKIFDPSSEVVVNEDLGRMMTLGGGVLLGIGASLFFGSVVLWHFSAGQQQADSVLQQKQELSGFNCELRNVAVIIGDRPEISELPELP